MLLCIMGGHQLLNTRVVNRPTIMCSTTTTEMFSGVGNQRSDIQRRLRRGYSHQQRRHNRNKSLSYQINIVIITTHLRLTRRLDANLSFLRCPTTTTNRNSRQPIYSADTLLVVSNRHPFAVPSSDRHIFHFTPYYFYHYNRLKIK